MHIKFGKKQIMTHEVIHLSDFIKKRPLQFRRREERVNQGFENNVIAHTIFERKLTQSKREIITLIPEDFPLIQVNPLQSTE